MRYVIVICLCSLLAISFQLPAFGQQEAQFNKLSKRQKHLLSQIAKCGKVESQSIGAHAIHSEQYARFDSLARTSSKSDIALFTKHSSAAVKIYAFQELLKQQNLTQALVVLQKNFRDTTAFELQNGCIKGANIVGKCMYAKLKSAIENDNASFDSTQKMALDEIGRKLPTYTYVKKIVARQIRNI
jgi:hypothetical protein